MHASRLVLVLGLLTGCVHNWEAYQPVDAAVADITADVVMTPDVVHPDVPIGVDMPIVRDVPQDHPIAVDVPVVMDVPTPIDVMDVPVPTDVRTDVPATDTPAVDAPTDAPTADVACGATGEACCFGALCSPGLVCGTDTICASMCTGGATACNSRCVDTNTDPNNCGTCGNHCFGSRPNCVGGACVR